MTCFRISSLLDWNKYSKACLKPCQTSIMDCKNYSRFYSRLKHLPLKFSRVFIVDLKHIRWSLKLDSYAYTYTEKVHKNRRVIMTNFHSPDPLLVYVKVQYHGEHDVNFQSSLFATPQLDFLEVSITFLRNFFTNLIQ